MDADTMAARITTLEANVARLEHLLISTRSLLQDTLMCQAARNAAAARHEPDPDCPVMTPERESAVKSIAGGIEIKHLKYINANCIVGKALQGGGRNRYGVKVTRRELTMSKYRCEPSQRIAVDRDTAEVLFG